MNTPQPARWVSSVPVEMEGWGRVTIEPELKPTSVGLVITNLDPRLKVSVSPDGEPNHEPTGTISSYRTTRSNRLSHRLFPGFIGCCQTTLPIKIVSSSQSRKNSRGLRHIPFDYICHRYASFAFIETYLKLPNPLLHLDQLDVPMVRSDDYAGNGSAGSITPERRDTRGNMG